MNKPDSFTFTLVSNTFCSLKCKHCYLTPEDFRDRSRMTKEIAIKIFDRTEEVMMLNKYTDNFNMEFLGGETLLMPFEYWEWLLPYAIERTKEISRKSGVMGNVNIYTNLFFKDHRYYDLLKKYIDDPVFVLLTSWEPDTERLGKKNELLPEFKRRITEIGVKELSITLTDGVIEMGAQAVYDIFSKELGITNYGFELLSLTGIASFNPHYRTHFKKVSDFMIDFDNVKEDHVGLSPSAEMMESMYKGSSLVFDGSEKYYFSFLPDGTTHYSTYAGDGNKGPNVFDDDWYEVMVWEGLAMLEKVMTTSHEMCNDCEYLRYCRGGNQSYKSTPKAEIQRLSQLECPGNKTVWEHKEKGILSSRVNLTRKIRLFLKSHPQIWFKQDSFRFFEDKDICASDKNSYIKGSQEKLKEYDAVVINNTEYTLTNLLQRCLFFEEMQFKQIVIDDSMINSPGAINLVRLFLTMNMSCTYLSADQVKAIISGHPESHISKKVHKLSNMINAIDTNSIDLINGGNLEGKHEPSVEILFWLLVNDNYKLFIDDEIHIGIDDQKYISSIKLQAKRF